jgi:hypothetical protein
MIKNHRSIDRKLEGFVNDHRTVAESIIACRPNSCANEIAQ